MTVVDGAVAWLASHPGFLVLLALALIAGAIGYERRRSDA
jgi:hypothetical protein